ncbi:DNA-binding transcriptional LysR family regulator [Herbaspirillum sp. Sphag1AN]|uniref:LysR family transcriptional regulator n=1 Tax=unclassified Herbaspirillum TaxID=2624150 RepID=UPI00160EDB25|nr:MULTISPECIES: LysR family transcriptional regulator [unclassified Herbaspirillum]MBB3212701.1 DNA-binding transcriptional LysR family regulator [Herbaspirillum sp. Sphag1AN]MBB3245898.1 DNA-binding transcriptional LysR family regulator [Herbaspirillum sp. Sphag64]
MDRLTSMAVFVAAAEEGSLSSAARRFGLSASMAGKHVSAIETELKVRLMQRSTRQLRLTDAGQTYLARCKRILEELDDANREASATQQAVRGVLRVAAPLTFGALHLGNVTASYLASYPEVNVEMLLSDRYVDLLAEGIDVAIRIGRLQDSDLVARRLAPCRMVFCAAPRFCEQHGTPRDMDALRHAPRLVFSDVVSDGDWTLVAPDGRTGRIDGPVRMSSNNMQMLLATALAGGGIAYGPSFVFGEHIARGELIQLLPDHRNADLAIHAVYPSKRHVSLKLRSFITHLAEGFGDTPSWDLALPSQLPVR